MFEGFSKLKAALPLIVVITFLGPASCSERKTNVSGNDYYLVDYTHSNILLQAESGGFFPVKGRFLKFGGEFKFDPKTRLFTYGEIYIKSNSFKTGNHATEVMFRSPDFLDISVFPEIFWKSKSIEFLGDGKYRIIAEVTVRDRTLEVPFDAEFTGEGIDRCNFERAAFSATGSISRKDFALGGERLKGLGDRVDIMVDISGALVNTSQYHYKCGNTLASRRHM